MDEIKKWLLDGCDYNTGIELYKTYGKDLRLKKFVFTLQNRSASIAARLKSELAAIAGISLLTEIKKTIDTSQNEAKKTIISPEKQIKTFIPEIDYSKITDKRLKILTFDRITLFKKANELRNKRLNSSDEDQRFLLLKEELECRRQNNIIWKELNHFQTTGKILGIHPFFQTDKDEEKFSAMSKMELAKKLSNIPTYICKIQKEIAASKDPALISKKQAQLEKHMRHKKLIEKLLNG